MKDSPVTWFLQIDNAMRHPHGLKVLPATSAASRPWLRWIASSLSHRTCGALEEASEDRELSDTAALEQAIPQPFRDMAELYLSGPRGERAGYELSQMGITSVPLTEPGRYELFTADGAVVWSADLTSAWHVVKDKDPPDSYEVWRLAAAAPDHGSTPSPDESTQPLDQRGLWTVPRWGIHIHLRRVGGRRWLELAPLAEPTP